MEINDRNVLLQQFFGAQKSPMVTEVSMDGFADILKAGKVEVDDKDSAADFIATKKMNISESVEDNKVVFKKDDSVKKKQVEASNKDSEVSKPKNKTDNDGLDDKDAVSYVENNNENVSDKKEVKSSEEVVEVNQGEEVDEAPVIESVDVAVEEKTVYSEVVLPVLNIESNGSNVAIIENNITMPIASDKILVENEFAQLPQEEFKVVDANTEVVTSEAPVFTEEDALLMEQARYIDDKVTTPKKLKINVDVKEEKVAASINKDVLHNRFEIDSIFQKVEEENLVDIDIMGGDFAEVDVLQENYKPTTIYNKPNDAQVFASAVSHTQEAATNASSDAINLSVSGKEVVFETSNALRQDVFTKINESSSRDAFKGIAKDVVEQIKINITKSAIKGVDTIDIQLKPEDLGKIQIKMYIGKDGKLQADIIASRPETMDILQKDVSGLAKAFNDAGYETDNRSFNFSFQGENEAREQQKDDSGLLKFIGDSLEQEAEGVARNDNLAYDPILGLNIRV